MSMMKQKKTLEARHTSSPGINSHNKRLKQDRTSILVPALTSTTPKRRVHCPRSSSSSPHLLQEDLLIKCSSGSQEEDELACSFNPGWMDKIHHCPVYHPSMDEFDDPFVYLQKIAPEASKYGICKVVSPLISSIPAGVVLMKEKKGFKFTTQVQPLRLAKWDNDDKISFYLRGRNYTLRNFESMANLEAARKYFVSGCLPSAYLEREFWNQMENGKKGAVEYAINVDGSAFSRSSADPLAGSKWNLKELPRLHWCTLRLLENAIPGITDPMLYIGMLFSMFAWHVEDHYLYSINYHHCGAPKTWYGVPSNAALQFENVVQHYVYDRVLSVDGEDGAFNILAEKTTLFPPKILLQQGVPVYKAVQMPGEFVITFPRAYHAGFSHGFNCGEAVNFATADWYPFGAEASHRYARLRKMPVIPYEELLCKEAMLLSERSNYEVQLNADSVSIRCLKISFACLLRLHQYARWRIKKSSPSVNTHPKPQGTVFCILCRRECYVGHFMCNCYADPICLFHGSLICKCACGSSCNLFIRDDIQEMEDVAEMFEQEKGIHREVERQMERCCYLWKLIEVHKIENEHVSSNEKVKCAKTKKNEGEGFEKPRNNNRWSSSATQKRRRLTNPQKKT